MKKEFNFKKSKKVGNRFKNSEVKLTVTTRLDSDVVNWLRVEADKKGLPYQTFMNSILKQAMVGGLADLDALRKVIREELARKEAV